MKRLFLLDVLSRECQAYLIDHMNCRVKSPIPVRAAVLRRLGGPLRIERLEMEGPREDEVLVRLAASGICHTDIDYCSSGAGDAVVLGHEGAGVVERVGRKVTGVKRGDHVVLSFQSCGHCGACRRGHPASCRRFYRLNFGFARPDGSNALADSGVRGHFFGQSSFCTHALATERNLVRISKAVPLALMAPLGCGLQTGAGTVVNSLGVKAGSSLGVFGAGAVGLAAVMAGRIVGAESIVAVDVNPRRLELALELGATHGINPHTTDLRRAVGGVDGGGLDYIVESTGALCSEAIELLNPRGTAAFLTRAAAPRNLPGGRKVLKVVQGDAVPQRFIPRMIRWYQEGRFPFDRLVKFYNFRDINKAIADAKRGRTIKAVLKIKSLI